MKLQLIRNATLKLEYAGHVVLIDPYFAPRHSLPSFTGRSPNPLVDLPLDIDAILEGIDLVLVSHLHTDHFDKVAMDHLAKDLPIVCQPGDEAAIRAKGFVDVEPLLSSMSWKGIQLTRREGSHGIGPVVEKMGSVMGISLSAADEPSVYWCGDTVFYAPVGETISITDPDIIVTHSCGARWDGDLILMDDSQTVAVCNFAPEATVIATHMEALDHATIDRQQLRQTARASGIEDHRLLIPADGEIVSLGVGV